MSVLFGFGTEAGEQDSLFWAGSFLEQPAPNNRPVSNTKVEPGRGGTEPHIRGIKTLPQITTCQTKEWKCTLLRGVHYYYTDLLSSQIFPSANHIPLSMQHWAFLTQSCVYWSLGQCTETTGKTSVALNHIIWVNLQVDATLMTLSCFETHEITEKCELLNWCV